MGQSLSSPVDSVYAEKRVFGSIVAAVGTAQGLRVSHEDGHILQDRGDWLCTAVLDGHGGSDAAIHFSAALGDAVLDALNKPSEKHCGEYDEPTENPSVNDGAAPVFDETDENGKKRELNLMERKALAAQRGIPYPPVKSDAIDSSVKAAFADADAAWRQQCSPQMQAVGTTVTMACIKKKPNADGTHEVRLYNSGDSRACVVAENGEVKIETRDHKPDDLREKRRIERAEGFVSEASMLGPARVDGLLAVSRAMGDYQQKDAAAKAIAQKVCPVPDSYTYNAAPTDTVILCCDGVFDVISTEEVGQIVMAQLKPQTGSPVAPEKVCENLLRESFARKSQDNCTCCTVQLNGVPTTSRDYMLIGAAVSAGDENVHNHVAEFHRHYKFKADLKENAEKEPGTDAS